MDSRLCRGALQMLSKIIAPRFAAVRCVDCNDCQSSLVTGARFIPFPSLCVH